MTGKRLTTHEKQRILDLLAESRSLDQVARIVGRAKRTIFEVKHNPPPGARNAAQLRQLKQNPPKRFDELSDLAKLARKYGIQAVADEIRLSHEAVRKMVHRERGTR
jgi:IS30 family transposase